MTMGMEPEEEAAAMEGMDEESVDEVR